MMQRRLFLQALAGVATLAAVPVNLAKAAYSEIRVRYLRGMGDYGMEIDCGRHLTKEVYEFMKKALRRDAA